MDPVEVWATLQQFAPRSQSEQQRVWIQAELAQHPPREGQDPFSWLLWRSKIAEGVSEEVAWEWVINMPPAEPPIEHYGLEQEAIKQDEEMGGMEFDGGVKVEGGVKQEADYNFESNVAPQPSYASASGPSGKAEVKQEAQQNANVPAYQQSYVQTSDILPLPSGPVPYEDMEIDEPVGSLDDSGSDASSSGDSDDTKPIARPPGFPSVPKLPGQGSSIGPARISSPARSQSNSRTGSPSNLIDPALRKPSPKPSNTSALSANAVASSSKPTKARSPLKTSTPLPVAASSTPAPAPPATISMAHIRTLITRARLSSDSESPKTLWKNLRKRDDGSDPFFQPNPLELKEILGNIRQYGTHLYKKGMADNAKYAEQINRYLKAMAKDPVKWEPAILPMITLLSETMMSYENLTELKIGKSVKVVVEKSEAKKLQSTPQILAAFNKYKDYCQNKIMTQKRIDPDSSADVARKRKLDEASGAASVQAGSSKDAALVNGKKPPPIPSTAAPRTAGPSRTATPSTAATAPSIAQLRNAASTTSTSASAPPAKRPKTIPAFKKRDSSENSVPSPTTPTTPTAAPTNMLAATLAKLKQDQAKAKGTVAAMAREANEAEASESRSDYKVKLNRKGHTVKFSDTVPNGRPLVENFPFVREAKEFEPVPWQLNDDGSEMHGQSAHDMEVSEGQTLKKEAEKHKEEEENDASAGPKEPIEWYTPEQYDDSPLLPPTPECLAQEARERALLLAPGGSAADESSVQIAPPTPLSTYKHPPNLEPPVQDVIAGLLSSLGTLPLTLPAFGVGNNAPQQQYGNGPGGPQNYYQQAPPVYQQDQYPQTQQGGYGAPQYNNGYTAPGSGMPGQQGWQAGPSSQGGYPYGHQQQQGGPSNGGWGGGPQQGWGGDTDMPSGGSRKGRGGGNGGGGGTPNRGKKGNKGGGGGRKGSIPCTFFAEGHCLKGSECTYRH